MTKDKHDFKDEISAVVAQAWCTPENEHKEMDVILAETIISNIMKTTALRIAERLQSGEVSDGMENKGMEQMFEREIFKAMAAQMIKEIENVS